MQEFKLSKLDVEKERKNQELEKLEREKRLKLGLCHGTYENICERFSNLEMKCNIRLEDLSGSDILSDSDILHGKRELKNIEIDFKEILDRIAKLTEFNPGEFQETRNLLVKEKVNSKI